MTTISRAELAEAIAAGTVTVVDALPAAAYADRHLPGAINLTIEEIARAGDLLPDSGMTIVTYSTDRFCKRGGELAAALTEAGYADVRLYTDGIADWVSARLPVDS